jgi:hypothetical protein
MTVAKKQDEEIEREEEEEERGRLLLMRRRGKIISSNLWLCCRLKNKLNLISFTCNLKIEISANVLNFHMF